MEYSIAIFLLLFTTSFFAGIVDAIAGGGGLICLPVLLSLGLPPHLALGTNKFQGTVGTLTSSYSYYKAGLLNLKILYKGLLLGFIGTLLGSVTAQMISNQILEQVIPFLLIIIFIYMIKSPKTGIEDRPALLSEHLFYILFGFGLGFYDGFFGPGTGSFWIFALTYCLGYNLQKASAYTKVFNMKSNVIATACFALGANINYKFAICMAIGQFLGGRLGSHLAITKGAHLIRPVFIAVVFCTFFCLLYQNYTLFIVNSITIIRLPEFYVFCSIVILIAIAILIKQLSFDK